jgi:hypothetical protein
MSGAVLLKLSEQHTGTTTLLGLSTLTHTAGRWTQVWQKSEQIGAEGRG